MLLDRLERVSVDFPDKIAVEKGEESISYVDLVARARDFGRYLGKRFARGSRALLVVENSIAYPVILYGCWIAGITAVPIDANAKAREIRRVVGHVKPSVIVSSTRKPVVNEIGTSAGIPLIKADNLGVVLEGVAFASVQEAREAANGDEVENALILYTSGTSGNPKGVVLTHENLFANTMSIVEYLELDESDSTVVVLPFHYSYGNSVLHTHLAVGGTIFIAESMMYPQKVTDYLRATGATGFSGVPSTLALLVSRTDFADDPPPIRYLTQAGGAMGLALTSQVRESISRHTSLVVMYGQTEASARLTWLPPDRLDEKLGSAGKAIPGVSIRVVGEDWKPLSQGEIGEIVATGPNIMKGYWQNPEATAEAVCEGWLRTGDIGYIDEDGFVFLSGRATEMIKSGAHRISPAEIEEVVRELDFIAEVAVCGLPNALLGQVVAAFVVGSSSNDNERLIVSHCRKALSLHKVPREVVWIEEMPKTASGKARKHVLVQSYLDEKENNGEGEQHE